MNPWAAGLRRGVVPLVLGVVCWIASIPAIEDLDPLLKGLGTLLLVLALVITLATARSASGAAVSPGARGN